jgi:hypothetical protein
MVIRVAARDDRSATSWGPPAAHRQPSTDNEGNRRRWRANVDAIDKAATGKPMARMFNGERASKRRRRRRSIGHGIDTASARTRGWQRCGPQIGLGFSRGLFAVHRTIVEGHFVPKTATAKSTICRQARRPPACQSAVAAALPSHLLIDAVRWRRHWRPLARESSDDRAAPDCGGSSDSPSVGHCLSTGQGFGGVGRQNVSLQTSDLVNV